MLGGKTAYIGKVADDQLGKIFTHDIRAAGVTYDTAPLTGGLPTARSLIFVTPDAQRTMQTFLGACTQLGPEDINMDHITSSQVVYMEGYLWDLPRAKQAMLDAAMKAKESGVKVSLTLSDSFCVARFRDEFLELAEKYVDILFANESEILSLYQTEDFDDGPAAGAEALRDRRADAQREGLGRRQRRRGARHRRGQGREGRRHDRRRRRLRGRLPLRLHAGPRSEDLRQAGRRDGGAGHQPIRATRRRRPRSRRWPRRCSEAQRDGSERFASSVLALACLALMRLDAVGRCH